MKNHLLLLMMALLPMAVSAYDAEIKGLYYNFNTEAKTATVTYKSYNDKSYKHNEDWNITTADIPASVEYNGATYSVTSIGESAFQGCGGLTSVTIPEGVVSIGSNSFFECTSLASIRIPESVTYIGAQAFYGCTNLSSISIPDNAMSWGNAVFDMTQWYNEQKEGVVYVGNTVYKP